ncbi:hypothetical protein JNO12_04235 [Erwinia aphidicola]|nr:hypothetical protein [Erwinia aphidicola]
MRRALLARYRLTNAIFIKKDSSGNYDYTAGKVTAERTWGTRTIPRSAAVGSEIVDESQLFPPTEYNDYLGIECGKSATVTAKYTSAAAPVSGLNPPCISQGRRKSLSHQYRRHWNDNKKSKF